jgi:HAD superfamily hydrolase (TIGR01509 family)
MTTNNWIFDLMNTLVETPDAFDEEKRIASALGYKDEDKVRSIIYRICEKFLRQTPEEFLERFDTSVNINTDRELSVILHDIWVESVVNSKLKPNVCELLDEMRQAGLKLTLVSNTSPVSYLIIDKLGLRERFDAVIFSCDTGYLKPDPRIFQAALRLASAEPEETVIVGDKIRTDILGGKILGFRSILIESRARTITENNQNYVDAIVPKVADIRQLELYNLSIRRESQNTKRLKSKI